MKPSYGEQYKQLLTQVYAANIKRAAYTPRVINKRAALRLRRNPRLRQLLQKQAILGLVGIGLGLMNKNVRSNIGKAVGKIGNLAGNFFGNAAKGIGAVQGGITKGLGWLGSNAAKLQGTLAGGTLKGLGSLTGINALYNAGDFVSNGYGKLGDSITNAANTVSGWQSGAGNAIGNAISGTPASTPAAGTTNSSANSSGSAAKSSDGITVDGAV